MIDLTFDVLPKLQAFMEPSRYKVCHGGRGAGRSWGVARLLIFRAVIGYEKILCCREFQRSIDASVLTLLREQIELMGLAEYFEVQRNRIICKETDSEFIFEGIKQNVQKIKSIEGVSICWVEEAEKVSKNSWDVLIPTIRTEGSEFYITFNPAHDLDPSYQRFVVNPPPESIVVQANYTDNPFLPDTLLKEAEFLKQHHYDEYEHIWLGVPRSGVAGAYFDADSLNAAFAYDDEAEATKPGIDENELVPEPTKKINDSLSIGQINYE